jgi:branched-chain amino acid aminotransferase
MHTNYSKFAPEVLSEPCRGGVFETLRVYNGKVFRLEEHLERLNESCRTAGNSISTGKGTFKRRVKSELKIPGMRDASLRITVLRKKDGCGEIDFLVRPFKPRPDSVYRQGVKVVTSVFRRNSPAAVEGRIKSDEFLGGVLARSEKDEGAFEVLWLNQAGYLAEGTVSNIFLVKDKILKTPPRHCGALGGITRQVALEIADEMCLSAQEVILTRHDLYNADEAFLTNTNIEIVPVCEVDGRVIGAGAPGYYTCRLMEEFKRKVRED